MYKKTALVTSFSSSNQVSEGIAAVTYLHLFLAVAPKCLKPLHLSVATVTVTKFSSITHVSEATAAVTYLSSSMKVGAAVIYLSFGNRVSEATASI